MSGGAKVDIAYVAAERDGAALLQQVADAGAVALYFAEPGGRVVAVFGPGGAREGAPERIPADPEEARSRGLHLRSVLVYDSLIGLVAAPAGAPGAGDAVRLAADLAEALATRQYETESLSASLLELFEEVNLFYGITSSLHRVGGTEGICTVILDRACTIVKAARASILLADPHTGILRIVASRGISPEQAAAVRVRPGEGVVGRVMATGQARVVDDAALAAGERKADDRYASRSFISVPIRVFDPDELSGSRRGPAPGTALGVLNMTDKAGGGAFSSGDLKLLSALASQSAVLLDNTRLAGMEKEMGLARTIQESLLPRDPPVVPGSELAGICLPARNVGGDYYDLLALPGGRAGVLIADVSGHNVGAALMMAVSRAAFRAEISRESDPAEILRRSNDLLEADLARAELFVSVFLAVHDPSAGTLSYASAGHNPGLLHRAAGGPPEVLDAEGILLGVLPGAAFELRTVPFRPGDLLLLYTDGLTEARDPAGEFFGEERLTAALRRAAALPTAEVPRFLIGAVDAHTGAAPEDDRTAAVLRAVTMAPPGGGGGRS